MMISPDQYLEIHIDGKDEDGVLRAIKNLRSEISKLKHDIKYEMCNVYPSYDVQLSCSMEYLEASIREYLRRFGDDEEHRRKVLTRSDYRDAELLANMGRILRITYTMEYMDGGVQKICEYTADFSVDPLVTFKCERNAGEVTLDDELFHAYQALQDKITSTPGNVQYEDLKVLRSKMLETRKAKSIGGTWDGNEDEQRRVIFDDLSDIHFGGWRKNYSVNPESEHALTTPLDTGGMYGIISWLLRIDYRNDLQYPADDEYEDEFEDEPEISYANKGPVQPFIVKGTNDEPYNMDDLCRILEFTDEIVEWSFIEEHDM
ncbi:MAG: hypothetical protein LUD50_06670 [Clostridia bacterium]|nr:hypothetical protein [Clostridia bacterium]